MSKVVGIGRQPSDYCNAVGHMVAVSAGHACQGFFLFLRQCRSRAGSAGVVTSAVNLIPRRSELAAAGPVHFADDAPEAPSVACLHEGLLDDLFGCDVFVCAPDEVPVVRHVFAKRFP